MNSLKRTKTCNLLFKRDQPKIFSRNRQLLPIQLFYTQGVELVVKFRRFLLVKDDTVFMAIDIYKNYINKGGSIAHATIVPICISCIIISAKINEVYPPKIQELTELFDYIGSKQELFKIQALVLRQCQYEIPFQENILKYLQDSLNLEAKQKQKKLEEGIKIIYKCIHDSFYLSISNQTIGKALMILLGDSNCKQLKKYENKIVAPVLYNMRQKIKKVGLRQKDLNIQQLSFNDPKY